MAEFFTWKDGDGNEIVPGSEDERKLMEIMEAKFIEWGIEGIIFADPESEDETPPDVE